MTERTVFVNGLPSLYEALKKAGKPEKGRKYIRGLLETSFKADFEDKVDRFLEIPGGIFPADMPYFSIYSELIQLYTNGLYYSAVVLAGVLCERICYDVLSNLDLRVNQAKLILKQTAWLFKLNLTDVVNLLYEWKLIKDETKKKMHEIKDTRNRYVHPEKTHPNAKQDSLEMIRRISIILKNEIVPTLNAKPAL
jgi:hypothetical protein